MVVFGEAMATVGYAYAMMMELSKLQGFKKVSRLIRLTLFFMQLNFKLLLRQNVG